MNLEEVRANRGHLVVWHRLDGRRVAGRIRYVITDRTFGYTGPPRVVIALGNFASEIDVDPEELSLDG